MKKLSTPSIYPDRPPDRYKAPVRMAAIALGVMFTLWYTANLWVSVKLPFIETAVSAAARRPITIESAGYDLLRGFYFHGVEVRQNKPGYLPVHIGRVRVEPTFRFWPEPGISLRKITFEWPDIALRVRPEDPLHLTALLNNLSPELGNIGSLKILMSLSAVEVKHGNIAFVSVRDGQEERRELSNLSFSANWRRKGSQFTHIRLKSGPVVMTGQGESDLTKTSGHYRFLLSSEQIPLERFAETMKPAVPDAGFVQFYLTLDGDTRHFEPAVQAVFYGLSLHETVRKIVLRNLDGVARLSKNGLELKRLWFSLNGIPLFLNARVQLEDPGFSLKLSTDPSAKIAQASLRAAGIHLKDGWSGYVRLKSGAEQWTLSLRALAEGEGGLWNCRQIKFKKRERPAKESRVLFSMERLRADFSGDSRYLRAVIPSAFYNGVELNANLWLRLKDLVWGIAASVSDADASRLLAYIKKNYPVSGRISGDLSMRRAGGSVQSLLRFKISEGVIGPSAQLSHWAAQTGIEALKDVRFHSFTGELEYDKGFWNLRYLRLSGDAVSLAANLKMNAERIWGSLSVRFPSACVRSSELRWLLGFVRAGEWVDFDFKVAGHPASPRVQWLGGEFKKKVESHLPGWMKGELSRQVEKRLTERPVEAL